jgi:lipopolysaccharide transport protein LptA
MEETGVRGRIVCALVWLVVRLVGQTAGAEPPAPPVEPTLPLLNSIGGGRDHASSNTVITAGYLEFDYRRSIALFKKDVVVVDPQIRMESDELRVFFDATNNVKAITALGHVRLTSGDWKATCRKAVYTSRTGKVLMVGDAKVDRGGDSVMGNIITFWTKEDRWTCTPGKLIIAPRPETKEQIKKPVRQKKPVRKPRGGRKREP